MSDTGYRNAVRNAGQPTGRNEVGATQRVVDWLIRGFREGRYAPGQRLTEAALTSELGVSRGPVREALRRLAAEGFLELHPHRGATVRRVDRGFFAEVFAVREVLEGLAASLAARRINEPGHRELVLSAINDITAELKGEHEVNYLEDNIAFHQLVVDPAGNSELARLVAQLQYPAFRDAYFDTITQDVREEAWRGHLKVLEAILEGDPARAEQAMREHIVWSGQVFQSLPESVYTEVAAAHLRQRQLG